MTTEPRRAGAHAKAQTQMRTRSSSRVRSVTWTQLLSDSASSSQSTVPMRATGNTNARGSAPVGAMPPPSQQQQQQQAPTPRSGHAVTVLCPTESVLLFGGSNGKVFFNDFYVLEPSHYAAQSNTHQQHDDTDYSNASEISLEVSAVGEIAGLSQSSAGSCDEELALLQSQRAPSESSQSTAAEDRSEPSPLSLEWKQLVVTYAPTHFASYYESAPISSSENHTSSMDSQDSTGSRSNNNNHRHEPAEFPYMGGGRDYHSMHYIPTSRIEDTQKGMRVLVLGNILVATEDEKKRFEVDEFRIDEVRIHQSMLEAQWVPHKFNSVWKPRARHGHSSVLIGDRVYVFGGKNAETTKFYNDMFYFDVRLNQWKKPPSTGTSPAPRAYPGMAACGDKIFMYGGYDAQQQFGGIYVYDVLYSRWDKVMALGEKPTARMNHTLTFAPPHHLIMFGGREHTSRQNDVSLFDTSTNTWKLLSPNSSTGSRSSSTQSQQRSSNIPQTTSSTSPVGRTAHSVVLYDYSSSSLSSPSSHARRKKPAAQRLLIFGGYKGSHVWLNDLQLLTISAEVFQSDAPVIASAPALQLQAQTQTKRTPAESGLGSSFGHHYKEDKARSVSAPARCSQSQSHPSQSQSQSQHQHHRPSSRADNPSVLTDITNQTAQVQVPPATAYTPAAAMTAALSSKRSLKSTSHGSDVRSQSKLADSSHLSNQTRELKKRKRTVDIQDSMSSGELLASQVSMQTAIIQLLQHSERMEEEQASIKSMVAEAQSRHQQDTLTLLERMEHELDAEKQKNKSLEKQLRRSEDEKIELKEQLVAADAELYAHRQHLQAKAPKPSEKILEEIQQYQYSASNTVEQRLLAIHETLEDMRHASGERTETDDSPQKRDSMFPDDDSTGPTSQPHMYPERVVMNLEERLRSALASNEELQEALIVKEAKLKRAEENFERTRDFLTWMQQQQQND